MRINTLSIDLELGTRATAKGFGSFSIVRICGVDEHIGGSPFCFHITNSNHAKRAADLADAINRIFAETDVARKTTAQSEIAAIVKQAAE